MGQAGLKRKTGLAMPALILGANLPDIDGACYFLDNMQHFALRRGITHGPIAWVLLPLVLAGLLYGFDRLQARMGRRPEKRLPVSFKWLYLLSLFACLTHPALDWMNVYGIRLLEPFSSQWFYGDVLFIIDVWLWAGLGFATWLSLRWEKKGGDWRKVGRVAIAGGALYVALNFLISAADRTLNTSFDDTISSPPPIAFWQRDSIGVVGPGEYYLDGERLGDVPLGACDLAVARRQDPEIEAFLFWSRAPVIDRRDDGRYIVGDARYYEPRSSGRFSVLLPQGTCNPNG